MPACVLVTHGFTSSHLFIGRASPAASEGTWSGLVGPGRAIDTGRFFVVSSNMLGSSYGSTAPASTDPATGQPYGPDFPRLTLSDIVAAQRRMLSGMGIERLVAVVGPSYGGFQALAWGIDHPGAVRGLSMSVSGLKAGRVFRDRQPLWPPRRRSRLRQVGAGAGALPARIEPGGRAVS